MLWGKYNKGSPYTIYQNKLHIWQNDVRKWGGGEIAGRRRKKRMKKARERERREKGTGEWRRKN